MLVVTDDAFLKALTTLTAPTGGSLSSPASKDLGSVVAAAAVVLSYSLLHLTSAVRDASRAK